MFIDNYSAGHYGYNAIYSVWKLSQKISARLVRRQVQRRADTKQQRFFARRKRILNCHWRIQNEIQQWRNLRCNRRANRKLHEVRIIGTTWSFYCRSWVCDEDGMIIDTPNKNILFIFECLSNIYYCRCWRLLLRLQKRCTNSICTWFHLPKLHKFHFWEVNFP